MSSIDEIKARLEAATPGPWVSDDSNIFSVPLGKMRHDLFMERMGGKEIPHPDDMNGYKGSGHPLGFIATTTQEYDNFENNEDFIANAPADIAFLLSEIERLTEKSDRWETTANYKAAECDYFKNKIEPQ